ncbi:retrovirus-related pol polyprotein from transposon TNT 1-94 [Tanacetum coccineum]
MVPRTVLTRSGQILINAVKPVNTIQSRTTMNNAGPMKNVINNAYSTARRPFNKITAANNSNFTKKVNTVKGTRVNTARPKAVLSAVKGNKGNVGNPHQDLKDKGVIDSGCSRHMTRNRSYLTDYKEIDGGFVAFWRHRKSNLDLKVESDSDDHNVTESRIGHDQSFVKMQGYYERRKFSVARTLQKLRVAERKNMTLMRGLDSCSADSKLPTTFWAEAVNTACYVQNRVLVIKPQNKTPYELFLGRKPTLNFIRPFRCPVTILNTIDHLGKFDGKANEGFFIGYSTNSKAFRVLNSRARIVEENLHVQFSENTPNIVQKHVMMQGEEKKNAEDPGNEDSKVPSYKDPECTKACDDAGKARMETVPGKDYILLPLWPADLSFSQNSKSSPDARFKPSRDNEKNVTEELGKEGGDPSNKNDSVNITNNINTASDGNSTNNVNTISSTVNTSGIEVNAISSNSSIELLNDPNMPELEDIVYSDDYEDVGVEADMNNLNTFMPVFKNKKDKRGIVIRNKARLVAQGYAQEERIDYNEVFTPVARIEAIRLFLAYVSFKYFVVYQMDVKSAFLYGKIEKEVYVCQPPGFEDPDFPNRVYKGEKVLYRLHQAPRACTVQIASVVANSTTEAEYVAASSCCGQVLWIQNQLLDYGHCELDITSSEIPMRKKLIQIDQDSYSTRNATDLLTKAFDCDLEDSTDHHPSVVVCCRCTLGFDRHLIGGKGLPGYFIERGPVVHLGGHYRGWDGPGRFRCSRSVFSDRLPPTLPQVYREDMDHAQNVFTTSTVEEEVVIETTQKHQRLLKFQRDLLVVVGGWMGGVEDEVESPDGVLLEVRIPVSFLLFSLLQPMSKLELVYVISGH